MKRVSIIGTSGCGKTTLGRALAARLHAVSVDLDDLSWEANWTEVPTDEFRHRLETALQVPRWVTSGNYGRVQKVYLDQADTIVWLDYSFPVIWQRVVRRTWRRVLRGEPCCNGNRETWSNTFSRDSILVWVVKTYHSKKRRYEVLFETMDRDGVVLLRHRTPHETQQWLSTIANQSLSANPD